MIRKGQSLPPYNPNVLLGKVAIGKLVVTTIISCTSDNITATDSSSHTAMLENNALILYALPSLLYNIANAVMFVTIGTISPGKHAFFLARACNGRISLHTFIDMLAIIAHRPYNFPCIMLHQDRCTLTGLF